MQMIMWVCPKCGSVKHGKPEDICSNCGSHVVNTGITLEEWILSVDDPESRELELIQKYAPNCDPDAKQRRLEKEESERQRRQFTPKCPTCGSPSIRKLSATENGLRLNWNAPGNANMAGKTFICNNCGYTW